jgi:hypothetical protein
LPWFLEHKGIFYVLIFALLNLIIGLAFTSLCRIWFPVYISKGKKSKSQKGSLLRDL